MKIRLPLVLLFPLISSCAVYAAREVERTEADLNKKETKVDNEIDRVQKEIEALKKETANK